MKRNILIAGAGQLGSRYLQGMAKCEQPMDIWVYDISMESLELSQNRWLEVFGDSVSRVVQYTQDLDVLPSKFDLAVIATTAEIRSEIVKSLSEKFRIEYWVLEKVLAQNIEQLLSIGSSIGNPNKAWVNTPMHIWSLYSKIRERYAKRPPIKASFQGFNGLACNAIHYIDFICRWGGSEIQTIDCSGLQKIWKPAKRINNYEVEGEMKIFFSDGSLLILTDGGGIEFGATLCIDGDIWDIFEGEGYAKESSGVCINGLAEYQSQMTPLLVQSIFENGNCNLPNLLESINQHKPLINSLLDHWNLYMPQKKTVLPIT